MRVEGFKNGGGAEETNVYGARLHQIGSSELLRMGGWGWAGLAVMTEHGKIIACRQSNVDIMLGFV